MASLCSSVFFVAGAQTATDLAAFKGLAPVSALSTTDAGNAALKANLAVTGGIQRGTLHQPTLYPLAEQQQQSMRDAISSLPKLADLSEGLGSRLSAVYIASATDKSQDANSLPQKVTDLLAYSASTSGRNSNAGKYFFANGTTNGTKPVSDEAMQIFKDIHGTPDPFGRAYNKPAGGADSDKYGDARPFQTEPSVLRITGTDASGKPVDNAMYNDGPLMDLTNSPSYPSGHTTYGYTGSLLLALMVPQRYQQMVARGAEFGNDRIIIGAHYAMDVLGGRALALYDMAHLLANDPAYMGQTIKGAPPITDFRAEVIEARAELTKVLEAGCGKPVAACAQEDSSRFHDAAANKAFYDATQTYDLGVVFAKNAKKKEDVGKLAPEAGYLLTVAFPSLTLKQADKILTDTEGPGGGFLDNGSGFGVYSRIDLYAAAGRAKQLAGM
jgi:hypothetical protein